MTVFFECYTGFVVLVFARIYFRKINNKIINKQLKNYLSFTISCIFIFIPIFISLGGEICKFVFGNMDSGKYLSYSAWTMIPLGFAQITTSILRQSGAWKLMQRVLPCADNLFCLRNQEPCCSVLQSLSGTLSADIHHTPEGS